MMTPEERIRAAVLEYQANAERALTEGIEGAKGRLAEWVKELLDGLTVTMPIGVKPILDAGGAVRQVVLDNDERQPSRPAFQCRTLRDLRELHFDEIVYAARYRITVIVEPMAAAKGEKRA